MLINGTHAISIRNKGHAKLDDLMMDTEVKLACPAAVPAEEMGWGSKRGKCPANKSGK